MGAFDVDEDIDRTCDAAGEPRWLEYADIGGDSGISHYRLVDGAIDVRFKRGAAYRYRARDVMPGVIEAMRWLAEWGDDLNRFLNEHAWGAGRRLGGDDRSFRVSEAGRDLQSRPRIFGG